jgi:CRP-like cAMP-binding protein
VFKRLEVRALQPGEVLLKQGASIPSLFVVGGGRLVVERTASSEPDELLPGGFVFADKMMSAKTAPATVVAGDQGALVLYAPRSVAHELMMSVPPLLEVLAG